MALYRSPSLAGRRRYRFLFPDRLSFIGCQSTIIIAAFHWLSSSFSRCTALLSHAAPADDWWRRCRDDIFIICHWLYLSPPRYYRIFSEAVNSRFSADIFSFSHAFHWLLAFLHFNQNDTFEMLHLRGFFTFYDGYFSLFDDAVI